MYSAVRQITFERFEVDAVSVEDKWLRWQRLMRQVNMTSLGQGTSSGTTLASTCSTDLDSVLCKCGSVLANDGGLGAVSPRQWKLMP